MRIKTPNGDELTVALSMDFRLKIITDDETLSRGTTSLEVIDATDAELKLLKMSGWHFKNDKALSTDDRFGACPLCGKTDGYLNVERVHYGICETHQTAWHIGSNLFSDWHDESPADWSATSAFWPGA